MRRWVIAGMLVVGCDSATPEPEPFLGDESYVRDPALNVELISGAGEAISHAVGENCMQCHQKHGPGPGLFTAAGTLHDEDGAPFAGGLIELRTGPNGAGDLVVRLEVDELGNFYTTEALPLPDMVVFPTVYAVDGVPSNFMPFPTSSAACNVCHAGGAAVRLKG